MTSLGYKSELRGFWRRRVRALEDRVKELEAENAKLREHIAETQRLWQDVLARHGAGNALGFVVAWDAFRSHMAEEPSDD